MHAMHAMCGNHSLRVNWQDQGAHAIGFRDNHNTLGSAIVSHYSKGTRLAGSAERIPRRKAKKPISAGENKQNYKMLYRRLLEMTWELEDRKW